MSGRGPGTRAAKSTPGRFVERVAVVDGVRYPFQVFVPGSVATRPPVPAILFLHGADERGSDGVRQTKVGLGPFVAGRAADFPAIVVMPQVPAGGAWSGTSARLAIIALDAAIAEFGGDSARVCITGISMGGYGACEVALGGPQRFAALVPICGGLRPVAPLPGRASPTIAASLATIRARAAERLASIPTWVFHGASDPIVPVEESRALVEALRKTGAIVQYTEYEDTGHESWNRAYAEPDLWAWLFAQRRQA